ncbi:MAG: DUF3021 family protein [Clostridiales bacterium]|nr:DUF3021 family protein [Clostridiales bacterium]
MKDHIKETLGIFFIAVTLIDAAMFILGMMLQPDMQFGYEAFVYPLIYGAIGCIPSLIFYTKKEMTFKQALVRDLLQMFMIAGLIVGVMFGSIKLTSDTLPQFIGVVISIVIIYILVNVIGWVFDMKTAVKMTEDLKKYQEKITEENA